MQISSGAFDSSYILVYTSALGGDIKNISIYYINGPYKVEILWNVEFNNKKKYSEKTISITFLTPAVHHYNIFV